MAAAGPIVASAQYPSLPCYPFRCFPVLSPPSDCAVHPLPPKPSSCRWSTRHHEPNCTGIFLLSCATLQPVRIPTAAAQSGPHFPWWRGLAYHYETSRHMWRPSRWPSKVVRGSSQRFCASQRMSPWRPPSSVRWLLPTAARLLPWRRRVIAVSRTRQLSKNPIRPLCGGSDWWSGPRLLTWLRPLWPLLP